MPECLRLRDVKYLAASPKHYRARILRPKLPTRVMRIGTILHFMMFGPRHGTKPICAEPDFGDLRATDQTSKEKAKENKTRRDEWRATHTAADYELVTANDWAAAEPIAAELRRDPVANDFLEGGRFEVPLEWEEAGFKCSTTGVDILNAGRLVDLKATSSVAMPTWEYHAQKMLYHAQMAWYRKGARANGIDISRGLYLLGIEYGDPWDVRALELTEKTLEDGDKAIALWLERLRGCERDNVWPGYAQAPTPWEIASWGGDDDEEESEEEAA
jgi:hypothetical protein